MLGKYGFDILERDKSFEILGKVGLYYILFLASLEMDMEGLKKNMRRIGIFGMLTFLIPASMMYLVGIFILQYHHSTSLLLSCIMASNTLIAYPIVARYGLQRKPSVTLSVGGSMLSLLLSLVVLAALEAAQDKTVDILFWFLFLAKFIVYCTIVILIIPRLSRWFLRRYSDAVMQYIFVMSMMFMSAALSEAVGIDGIFGAFMAGLILNRYIPRLSALMNRIEFIGNALFIPYFLIGVGMLINVRLLFDGGNIIWIVLCFVFFGTFGKAVAAYVACIGFRMPLSSGHMTFGLTCAHAAGAIAMVMVGMETEIAPGVSMVNDDILNGVVMMILFTCVISTIITEQSAQRIVLRDKDIVPDNGGRNDDEKFLIPVKYPEYANNLINLGILMRNTKLNRGLVALNVVYDDENMRVNQEKGQRLLEQVTLYAAGSDVRMQTQVRIAANIANGIKHAFKEFRASEIIIGMHTHKEVSPKFWGEFHQSLFNGLSRQIIMARIMQPLNTVRRIQVCVPSRAQFEAGFYRWLERLSRLADNLECRINFHGRKDTLELIAEYAHNRHPNMRAEYTEMLHWNELPKLAGTIAKDHIFVVVTARKGTISYKNAMDRLPDELTRYYSGTSMMIIFPDQFGDAMDKMTFSQPQHTEEESAYETIREWMRRRKKTEHT
ncbi:MAG: cation:proton antiporter, partial [Prevotella sp.]|nr:cation:proton antiporter [Prevotella sp.]